MHISLFPLLFVAAGSGLLALTAIVVAFRMRSARHANIAVLLGAAALGWAIAAFVPLKQLLNSVRLPEHLLFVPVEALQPPNTPFGRARIAVGVDKPLVPRNQSAWAWVASEVGLRSRSRYTSIETNLVIGQTPMGWSAGNQRTENPFFSASSVASC